MLLNSSREMRFKKMDPFKEKVNLTSFSMKVKTQTLWDVSELIYTFLVIFFLMFAVRIPVMYNYATWKAYEGEKQLSLTTQLTIGNLGLPPVKPNRTPEHLPRDRL